MMTLIVTLYGRGIISGKPDEQLPLYVLVPIFILMASALITIIFAILSTRPKITQGTFSKEDIAGKKINLLFFGNFYKMHVDDYMDGMKTLMKDKDYLYDTMLKDIYYLGHVLGQKFKLLRISYNVFMFGLILTLASFVIMYILG
jgi:pycsar effector protein